MMRPSTSPARDLAALVLLTALVLLFFMHLRSEGRFLKIMLGTALGALTLIIILTFSDVWFRR